MRRLLLKPLLPFDFRLMARQAELSPWKFDGRRIIRVERIRSGRVITIFIESDGTVITVRFSELKISRKDIEDIREKLEWCLAVSEDLQPFYDLAKNDKFLRKAVSDVRGYRILCDPTVFESAVKAICNQNTSFKMAKVVVKNLVEKYGEGVFPCQRTLTDASVAELKECKVGYRAEYISAISRLDLEALKSTSTEEARRELLKVKGIGPHTAALILQRGLRRHDSFFIDLWVRRLMRRLYFKNKVISDNDIIKYAEQNWGRYRGLALQYLLMDMKNLM